MIESSERFRKCVAFVLREEGGYSDRAADRGGPTNRGITWRTLAGAKQRGIVSSERELKDLTEEEAEAVYWTLYWVAAPCPDFPAPLDLLLFDAFVQHTPRTARMLIQEAVDSRVDGIIGTDTVRAAHEIDPGLAVTRYASARMQFYRKIVEADATQKANLHGWLNRLSALKVRAMSEIA